MFDGPLMLQMNWPVVDTCTIPSVSNKFGTAVKIKPTGELKFKDNPAWEFRVFSFAFYIQSYSLVLLQPRGFF